MPTEAGLEERRSQIHAGRRKAARQLGAGADEDAIANMASKRTNWLLIKHRDEYAKDGDGEGILDKDRSVASGRDHGCDRGGQGQETHRLHAHGTPCRRGAVWNSRKKSDPPQTQRKRSRSTNGQDGREVACRASSRRNCAGRKSGRRPAQGWVHEIKFDGYRIQARIETGKRIAVHAQGSGLERAVLRDRPGRAVSCPTRSSTARWWRWIATARRISPAFRRRCRRRRPTNLVFFVFDLLFEGREDLRERFR